MRTVFELRSPHPKSLFVTKNLPEYHRLPHQIVIFPNNEVNIDGFLVHWESEEFIHRKIPLTRVGKSHEADYAEHRVEGDTHIMIFATMIIDQSFKGKCNSRKSLHYVELIR